MEYVYAALLLDAAGKEVTEKSLLEVVKAAGFQPDEARAKAIVTSLKDVNIKDVIKNAQAMPTAPAAAAAPQGAPQAKKEEKKEAQKTEEEAASGLAGLFG